MSSEGVTRRMKLQNIVSLKHYKLKRTRCITHFFALVSFHQCFISEVYYTYIPCFVSSSFKERDIYYAFFRVVSFHQCFMNAVYYTYLVFRLIFV